MDALEQYLLEQNYEDAQNGRPLHEIAYKRLGDAIRHADIQPGAPISANQLSKVLGISRTPVRQALQMLAQDGLVEIIPGRAIAVASRSVREILDTLVVRSLLELKMIELIVENITPEQLQNLQDIQKQLEQAVIDRDLLAWSKVDVIWHETLNKACPNQTLAEMNLRLRNRIHRNVNMVNKLGWDVLQQGTAEHGEIIQAIANKDKEQAVAFVAKHLTNIRENLLKQLIN